MRTLILALALGLAGCGAKRIPIEESPWSRVPVTVSKKALVREDSMWNKQYVVLHDPDGNEYRYRVYDTGIYNTIVLGKRYTIYSDGGEMKAAVEAK